MIAVDTNFLIYAHRPDYPNHERARTLLKDLLNGRRAWGVPTLCLHEFLANVTKPRLYPNPTPMDEALKAVDVWTQSPQFSFLNPGADHLELLDRLLRSAHGYGGLVFDAGIAAVCLANGVTELWTADRDFSRFPSVPLRNPLVEDL